MYTDCVSTLKRRHHADYFSASSHTSSTSFCPKTASMAVLQLSHMSLYRAELSLVSAWNSYVMSSNSMTNPLPLFPSLLLRFWVMPAVEEIICITLWCLLTVYVVLLLCARMPSGHFQEFVVWKAIHIFTLVFFLSKSFCMRCSLAPLIFCSCPAMSRFFLTTQGRMQKGLCYDCVFSLHVSSAHLT